MFRKNRTISFVESIILESFRDIKASALKDRIKGILESFSDIHPSTKVNRIY